MATVGNSPAGIPALHNLVRMTDEQLARVPLECMHLACAVGVPGSEKIDYQECLNWVLHATRCATHFTLTQREDFLRDPGKWDNSPAYFRVESMMFMCVKYLGIRYNHERIPLDSRWDLEDSFIHGAIFGNGGTCSTLPVLYAAIGRRLGYPIKLVHAHSISKRVGHNFARWDDPKGERMNFEGNQNGMSRHPDDHYRTGMYAVPADVERRFCLLKSKTPRQELSDFLLCRAGWWQEAGHDRAAASAAM